MQHWSCCYISFLADFTDTVFDIVLDADGDNMECVQVLVNDIDIEGDETFSVTLSDPNNIFVDSPQSNRIFTITDGTPLIPYALH